MSVASTIEGTGGDSGEEMLQWEDLGLGDSFSGRFDREDGGTEQVLHVIRVGSTDLTKEGADS